MMDLDQGAFLLQATCSCASLIYHLIDVLLSTGNLSPQT